MRENIRFISSLQHLVDDESLIPQPTKKFIPQWWKDLPVKDEEVGCYTAKICPSFTDYFSEGYVIPMWDDTLIQFNQNTGEWFVQCGDHNSTFVWEVHHPAQMSGHQETKFFGQTLSLIFKAISPWRIITPKGWSVYQNPLYYHFDNDFYVLPGIIDTDIHHEINQQVAIFKDEVFIKKGQPFVQYTPFKRTKTKHSVSYETPEEKQKFEKLWNEYNTKGTGAAVYRKLQTQRDK
jgi:hypothetical protein